MGQFSRGFLAHREVRERLASRFRVHDRWGGALGWAPPLHTFALRVRVALLLLDRSGSLPGPATGSPACRFFGNGSGDLETFWKQAVATSGKWSAAERPGSAGFPANRQLAATTC